ncbi:peptidase domain-containing ABC transporter [Vibrio cholerae]
MFFNKKVPIIYQAESSECGLACLAMISQFWGKEYDLPTLRKKYPITLQGASLNNLIQVADSLDLTTRALRVELGSLTEISLPAIIHWEFNHFVVLSKVCNSYVIIHDPGVGQRKISINEFSKSFTGIVLELKPTVNFEKEKKVSRIGLMEFFSQVRGLTVPLIQLMVFSLLLQFVAITIPFFSQIAIDDVVPSNDLELLRVLAFGFGMLYCLNPFVSWLRSRLIIYISSQFSSQLTLNLVRHLFSLPLQYFEKRGIGDLLTRFDASERLRELLTHGFITTIVDVAFAAITIGMMLYYSTSLAAVVLIVTFLVLIVRLFFISSLKLLVNECLHKKGIEQSELIESLRGIASMKFSQREFERESIWNNRFTAYINTSAQLEATQKNYELIHGLITSIGMVTLIYLGIIEVMDMKNTFTLGAFFAFAAYRDLFFERLSSFLGVLVEFSMARVHLERLAEILTEEPEIKASEIFHMDEKDFSIQLHQIGYSYGNDEKQLFSNVDLHVEYGDRIIIYGASGTGKSTLLKVLSGVYPATEGKVSLNGRDISYSGLRYLRSHMASVLQNDYLFKGSVVDNITFFDRSPNLELAIECAKIACVHDEIMNMPMAYESIVSEMGTSLSQGQQQRVLLARALYQRKPILILDEGTAHLDEVNEKNILENLKGLGITIIMTAHKSELCSYGTKSYLLTQDNGLMDLECKF